METGERGGGCPPGKPRWKEAEGARWSGRDEGWGQSAGKRRAPGRDSLGTTCRLRESLGTFRMPVLPPKWLANPFLTFHGAATSRLGVPPKQRRRQNDTDFVLPSYEQLFWPQHTVTPRGSSCCGIPGSIAPPAPPTATTVPTGIFPVK